MCHTLIPFVRTKKYHNVRARVPLLPEIGNRQCDWYIRAYSDQRRTFFSRVLSVSEHSHLKKSAGRRRNTSAMIGLYVIMC